ncbi:SDR family oxidoreductase [Agrobacterium radiobacter]|uniref:Dehydrogenase n=1 Tax=Agrobacterium tumefaciens str. B6 TaxID=1183423 RepID=A0A822V5I5_AGRTU|nr:SDR family oxidoreductase [Agrobacterium tumefaciens]KWT82036.1 dehydrogenase [Agrobacterium tumefaciens str. B6]MQB28541.1 SDR family oxidoreductase [Agrobacterium tumefaciens]NTA07998.1 SDR family oxidoreductase [Agrobacterium tumefaciens]NTA94394.1 SDR family oxidoreductase [Agrobacterium tumefaciens]NTB15602.1 SDR family oxidoreductase [Agrobacterium tumefaciens]
MTKTILITGTSSGYGKSTAEFFLSRGWNVVATMRRPDPDRFGGNNDRLRVLPLDVTDGQSIAALIDAAGPVDVLVNNAGIGMVGAFEATPMSAIRTIFDTNSFGVMAMTQAIIPQMRKRRSGAIINVTSSATLASFPLAAAYTASKQAIEGFSGSLAHELGHFNIRVKLVEPGYAPTTRFTTNAILPLEELLPDDYMDFAGPVLESFAKPAMTTSEQDVAEAIWSAVHDVSGQLRFPAGPDAIALAQAG